MTMRLLPKSEIDTLKAKQRQREIDEGLKLTRRVDSIREAIGEEEANLEKFRRETIASIQSEIEPLADKRDLLKKEVQELKSEREEALKPIDDKKHELELEEIALSERETKVLNKEIAVKKDRKEATELLRKAKQNFDHSQVLEEEAVNRQKDATIKLREAGELMEEAETARRETNAYVLSKEADISEEYRKLDLRKEALDQREERIIIEEAELRVAKIKHEDRMATLERALKRKS